MALIVIDVLTLFERKAVEEYRHVGQGGDRDPDAATSPSASGASES